jgi:hypothetical protein
MTTRNGNGRAAAGRKRGRRISPLPVMLVIALIGSIAFLGYVITVRDPSQIPLLTAGGVALGIVFLALAGYLLRSTWRAGVADRGVLAMGYAIAGGVSAIIGCFCIASGVVLFLLSQSPG